MDMSRTACAHCGLPVVRASDGGADYCCAGCEGAANLLRGLGLERYYELREIDPAVRPLKPEDAPAATDLAAFVREAGEGKQRLDLMVDGLHCAACVWLIESVLAREADIVSARVNLSTRRLALVWRGAAGDAGRYLAALERLGYQPGGFSRDG